MLLRAAFCKPPVPRQDRTDTSECSGTSSGDIPFTPTRLKAAVGQDSLHKLVTSGWLPGSCWAECFSWGIGNMLNRGSGVASAKIFGSVKGLCHNE